MACGWFSSGRARKKAQDEAPVVSPPPALRLIRVTDEQDGELLNRGYSYWAQACRIGGYIFAFVGSVGGYPLFFEVNEETGAVKRRGPLLPYRSTGEGWYFNANGDVYLCEGPRLLRVNPFTQEATTVFDISETHPGCRLWQAHSSDDGQVHNATVDLIVESGPYPHIGTVVYRNGQQTFYEAIGALDESQVTADGAYLVIKENDDNRIITLATGESRLITDAEGAVGHSDVGQSFVVGEDNILGACVSWNLPLLVKTALFPTWNMGHLAVRGTRCLLSGPQSLSLVPLAGGSPEHLLDHGMVGDGTYDTQVMGNLSPDGAVAAYVSNAAGRMDLYLALLG